MPDTCPSGDFSGDGFDGDCGTPPPTPDTCPGGDFTGDGFDGSCGTPPPMPSVTVTWGVRAPATLCGGDTSCTYVTISWMDFATGDNTLTAFDDGTEFCAGASCSSSVMRSGSSGTFTGYWAIGYCRQQHVVSATVDGVASNGASTVDHGC